MNRYSLVIRKQDCRKAQSETRAHNREADLGTQVLLSVGGSPRPPHLCQSSFTAPPYLLRDVPGKQKTFPPIQRFSSKSPFASYEPNLKGPQGVGRGSVAAEKKITVKVTL